jgi:hypothetical protein
MLVVDNLNPSYPMEFQKFLGTVTGSGPSSGVGGGVGGGSGTAAYY